MITVSCISSHRWELPARPSATASLARGKNPLLAKEFLWMAKKKPRHGALNVPGATLLKSCRKPAEASCWTEAHTTDRHGARCKLHCASEKQAYRHRAGGAWRALVYMQRTPFDIAYVSVWFVAVMHAFDGNTGRHGTSAAPRSKCPSVSIQKAHPTRSAGQAGLLRPGRW